MRQRPAEPGGPRLGQPPSHRPRPGQPSGILERTNPGRLRPGLRARPGMGAARTRFPCPDGRCRNAAWPTSLPN